MTFRLVESSAPVLCLEGICFFWVKNDQSTSCSSAFLQDWKGTGETFLGRNVINSNAQCSWEKKDSASGIQFSEIKRKQGTLPHQKVEKGSNPLSNWVLSSIHSVKVP